MDTMVVFMQGDRHRIPIDPKYIEVCESGTLEVYASQSNRPVAIGAEIDGGYINIELSKVVTEARVVLSLTGIRRGFLNVRFANKTRIDFEKNERWLDRG